MVPLRLAFMGTPDFAVPTLEALIEAGHEVVAVYAQPPRPAGRGQKPRPAPVAAFAESRGIPVHTPLSLKSAEEQEKFRALGLDAAVVVAYGLILPRAILDAPRFGCVNVHASLLPRWRGAAPIQRAIEAGDEETGVTIMAMDEGLDTGPMLLKQATVITPDDNAQTLHDRLSEMGARLILPALAGLADGSVEPEPQPADGVTYARKIEKSEARIDWSRPAAEIDRQIRAFAPFPGAWFGHDGTRIKVLSAEPVDVASDAAPGTVTDAPLVVACGEGALRLTTLQREGKSAMEAAALLRGYPLPAGSLLQ